MATPGSVYAAAISIAPEAAVAAAEVAHATGRPAEVAIVPADHPAPTDARVTTAAQAVSAESRALQAGADASASAPVTVAMVVASDAVVAEVAAAEPVQLAGRASSGRKPVAVKSRAAAQPAAALRGQTTNGTAPNARAVPNGAVAAHGAVAHAQHAATAADAPSAAPASSAAQAVGMTAAEFTHWLAATRDTARPVASSTKTDAGGTDLTVDLTDARLGGVWGWCDRPGQVAHWPGGLCLGFPRAHTVSGRLVLAPGDANLTFKRYIETPVALAIADDHVTQIEGAGLDAILMRDYFAAWGDRNAYAVSHVGWGMNPAARWEALTMYDKRDTNGTELRAIAGSFLYSTGANEAAGRFTLGHFDLPMRGCTIALDGARVVEDGRLLGELA
ncbi:MAG: peptidase M29 [Alphaproteobacteria bacterium]|nr:peptidase M29 [Alphaproteobacteria bacterium]